MERLRGTEEGQIIQSIQSTPASDKPHTHQLLSIEQQQQNSCQQEAVSYF